MVIAPSAQAANATEPTNGRMWPGGRRCSMGTEAWVGSLPCGRSCFTRGQPPNDRMGTRDRASTGWFGSSLWLPASLGPGSEERRCQGCEQSDELLHRRQPPVEMDFSRSAVG